MSERATYIAGNWKMNKSIAEARELATLLVNTSESVKHRIMIAPPFTASMIKSSSVISRPVATISRTLAMDSAE